MSAPDGRVFGMSGDFLVQPIFIELLKFCNQLQHCTVS